MFTILWFLPSVNSIMLVVLNGFPMRILEPSTGFTKISFSRRSRSFLDKSTYFKLVWCLVELWHQPKVHNLQKGVTPVTWNRPMTLWLTCSFLPVRVIFQNIHTLFLWISYCDNTIPFFSSLFLVFCEDGLRFSWFDIKPNPQTKLNFWAGHFKSSRTIIV